MRKIDFIVLTFFSIVALTTMQGCKKKEDKIEAPKLTFKALSSKSLLQFKDSLTVTFSYEDNDGDIGFYDADSSSVYIQDKRLKHPDLYFLKPLNPPNLKPKIKGDIQLGLRNMFLLGSGTSETTNFTIWIKDRKGNISNSIVTPEITIRQ